MAYLGLDWSNEEVDSFVQSRGSCGLLQFMSTFVRIIEEVRASTALQALTATVLQQTHSLHCTAGRRDGHKDAHCQELVSWHVVRPRTKAQRGWLAAPLLPNRNRWLDRCRPGALPEAGRNRFTTLMHHAAVTFRLYRRPCARSSRFS